MVKQYKRDFIEFLLKNDSLKFGEFTLKSGRVSPYFLNTGMLYSGEAIARLGQFYAQAIMDNLEREQFNVIFGPAYKGIPISVATVCSLNQYFSVNVSYSFNRKETKKHGDKGVLVGKKISEGDRIVIVDDVVTAGTAIKESIGVLRNCTGSTIEAIFVSVDRMERGKKESSAIQEISKDFGIKVFSIANIADIMEFLKTDQIADESNLPKEIILKMEKYRAEYGAMY